MLNLQAGLGFQASIDPEPGRVDPGGLGWEARAGPGRQAQRLSNPDRKPSLAALHKRE
jgi:hypothetical protein